MKYKQAQKIIFTLLFIFISSLPSCCLFGTPEEPTATELYEEGQKALAKEHYKETIEKFEKLIDWYPFDARVTEVELKIADAYFALEKYKLAVFEYEEFEKMHPANKKIPYVIFKTGLCHFNQIDTIDRDPSHAKKALKTFNKYLELYPNAKEKEKVDKKRTKCRENIAGHEMYVGKFYFKSKHYKSALSRFKGVLKNYSDTSYKNEALEYIKKVDALNISFPN